jgi:hypothetical protein
MKKRYTENYKKIYTMQNFIFEKREYRALLFFLITSYYLPASAHFSQKKDFFFFAFVPSICTLSQEKSKKNICFA